MTDKEIIIQIDKLIAKLKEDPEDTTISSRIEELIKSLK